MSLRRQNWRKGVAVPQWIDGRRSRSDDDHGEMFKHQMGDGLLERSRKMYRKDLKSHFGCINAIEFSNNGGHWIVSGGDDRRVLLWNVEKALDGRGSPAVMKGQHNSNIFCLAFDNNNDKIFSGGNDEQVIVHDAKSGGTLNVFLHQDALYGLSVDPLNDNVFASACDDGRVLIFDIRQPATDDPFVLAHYGSSPMHAVMYNPVDSRLIATANAKQGAALWDIRKPKSALVTYGGSKPQSCMSVRFSASGDRLLALRRRLPPVLYDIHSEQPVMQFHNSGYYNSCTMKSCSFAGSNDQYILSGSDDFHLYMWKIPDDIPEDGWIRQADFVLEGHRSIVNQVRYNADNCLIISSGVEKIIKVWSPFSISSDDGHVSVDIKTRAVFPQNDYMDLLAHNGPAMAHDYTNGSTEEDPRMIAFFDTLVQHELEATTDDDGPFDSSVEVRNNEISDLESSLTQTDVESLSLDSLPRASFEVGASLGLTYSNSDSLTSPSIASSSSDSSSSVDENCDDADKHSSDSSLSCVNAAVVSQAGGNGARESSPKDDVLNRLKRIRRAIASDSDTQSQDDAGESRRKRRHVQAVRFLASAGHSSVSETDDKAIKCIVHEKKDEKKEPNSCSSNGNRNAANEQLSESTHKSCLFPSRKLNTHSDDRTLNSKSDRCIVPAGDVTSVPVTVGGNDDDDVAGYSLTVSSSDCDPVSSEAPNAASNGASKSQSVPTSVGGSNGFGSSSERFRQIKNREKLIDRKYRTSAKRSKESDSDSD